MLLILISFGMDGLSKFITYVWVYIFPRIVTLLYSFIPCFSKAVSISSGDASDSSLLLTTHLEVFNFVCG